VTGIGETGDKLASLKVGDMVFVEGGLRLDSYENNGREMIGLNINAKYVTRIAPETERREEVPEDAH
jgi:single-stranded DNA-binding protein